MPNWTVVDLFSGCGGMSYGFHRHPDFTILGAADAQIGKPSSPKGSLQCNSTYELNMGIKPVAVDLSEISPADLKKRMGLEGQTIDVLSCCPPCTGFSRANPENHLRDDRRNHLVEKTAEFARTFGARVIVMENARELLTGNFRYHFDALKAELKKMGFQIKESVYNLSEFGLPQQRERALVVAAKSPLLPRDLREIWSGVGVRKQACTVRRALGVKTRGDDTARRAPAFASRDVAERMAAVPFDGGSWIDLARDPAKRHLLTPAMVRILEKGKLGSHPDPYGRMWWDRPAPTIKRECAHIGNGRYAHPQENRLLTVREMASIQGFPVDFEFNGAALSNLYRHIGDAVPPLVSFQLACLARWILGGKKPSVEDLILPGTHLRKSDLTSNFFECA